MAARQIQHKGIYKNLPVFPDSIKDLTAIVTGANGISGDHMLRVLNESPQRWKHIYAMSRRPPNVDRQLKVPVTHLALDFLNSSPEQLAQQMKEANVQADYVFFFSYIQADPLPGQYLWTDAEEMCRVNKLILANFLEGLEMASIKPKRIMLQTGAKNYVTHLGPQSLPLYESDPRCLLEPNFYYAQEDYLWPYCERRGIGWNICMPSFILGAVRDAAMNVVYPIGVYACVHAHLKKRMEWTGDMRAFETVQDQSSSMMNAYMEEWAVLTEDAKNEKFNTVDDSAFTYARLWPQLAKWYGAEYELPDDANTKYIEIPSKEGKDTPRGYGSGPPTRIKHTLTQWAADPVNKQAWDEISAKHGLTQSPFTDAKNRERIFAFGDGGLTVGVPVYMNMDKAHSMGWTGSVDSVESFKSVLKEFTDLKMLPPMVGA